MPNNKYYSNVNNDFIVGKSDIKNDLFVFARRDIIKVTIPPFIKVIGSHAFRCCRKLRQI